MGGLHQGHAALIRRAAAQEASVLVSVFVNPLQFGPSEDFERYPRTLEADRCLAEEAGAAALWAPDSQTIYPNGADEAWRLQVPASLQATLCGRGRPGHFDGVATVVARLLALVRPEAMVLGEKDWQQLVILRRLVHDLGLNVRINGVATVREAMVLRSVPVIVIHGRSTGHGSCLAARPGNGERFDLCCRRARSTSPGRS